MTNQTSSEVLRETADLLDKLVEEPFTLSRPTYFLSAADDLRAIAEQRETPPWKPRVYAQLDDDEPSVYIEKPDGSFIGVYTSAADASYTNGYFINENLHVHYGDLIAGGVD